MDPNVNLARLLDLAMRMSNGQFNEGTKEHASAADELAELVLALDGWLNKGGFLPDSWNWAQNYIDGQ